MPRSTWGTCARVLAIVSIGALWSCSVLFGLDGLDSSPTTYIPTEAAVATDAPSDSDSKDAPVRDAGAAIDADAAVFAIPEAGDGGDAPSFDANDATPDAVNDAPGPDVTCTPINGDGGGTVLDAFTTSDVAGWAASSNAGAQNAVLGWTPSDGNACAGALTLAASFTTYDGDPVRAEFTYSSAGFAWSGTRLHAWVKIVTRGDAGMADYQALGALQLYVNSGTSGANFTFVSLAANPTYSDAGWHEIVLDLLSSSGEPGRTGPDVAVGNIQRYGISIAPASAQPAGEPATPPPVLVLIDDVWLE